MTNITLIEIILGITTSSSAAILIAVAKTMWKDRKELKTAVHTLHEMAHPDKDGIHLPQLTKHLTTIQTETHDIKRIIDRELRPNSGESIRDRIIRIEERISPKK